MKTKSHKCLTRVLLKIVRALMDLEKIKISRKLAGPTRRSVRVYVGARCPMSSGDRIA